MEQGNFRLELTPDALCRKRAWLTRIRRSIEHQYVAAYLASDNLAMDELKFEHQRLVVTITTLGRWIAEAELYEAQQAAVREAEWILSRARYWIWRDK